MLEADTVIRQAKIARDFGIDVIFLQGGETKETTKLALEVVPAIRDLFGGEVEILLNLGVKPRADYAALMQAGVQSYILKHETSDSDLHLQTRKQAVARRYRAIEDLLDLGFHVGVGCISSLPGQTIEMLAADLLAFQGYPVDMVSVSPFMPARHTPLSGAPPGDVDVALNAIAILRLAYPNSLIPSVSALEALVPGSQVNGLAAGANVITANFSPDASGDRYLIYGSERFKVGMEHVKSLLSCAGLEPRGGIWRGAHRTTRQ